MFANMAKALNVSVNGFLSLCVKCVFFEFESYVQVITLCSKKTLKHTLLLFSWS